MDEGEREEDKKEEDKKEEDSQEPEEKPEKPVESSKKTENLTSKLRENPFILSTLICGVLAVLLLVTIISGGGITGKVVSGEEAGEKVLAFASSQLGDIEILGIEKQSGLYKITFISSETGESSVYTTLDGKYLINGLISLASSNDNSDSDTQDVPKSDKPVLEAFLSPYCPYGLQYMKGLIPVFDLLKNSADIRIRYIGVTHMDIEELETTRQLCILNEYNKEKLFDYLRNIIYNDGAKVCYNDWHSGEYARDDAHFTECMTPIIKNALSKINVDENKINNCIETNGEKYYQEAVDYSRESKVSASPTPKINGLQVSGRSPELIKNAICNAFNERPKECNIELSSFTPSPGIGGEAGTETTAQC